MCRQGLILMLLLPSFLLLFNQWDIHNTYHKQGYPGTQRLYIHTLLILSSFTILSYYLNNHSSSHSIKTLIIVQYFIHASSDIQLCVQSYHTLELWSIVWIVMSTVGHWSLHVLIMQQAILTPILAMLLKLHYLLCFRGMLQYRFLPIMLDES